MNKYILLEQNDLYTKQSVLIDFKEVISDNEKFIISVSHCYDKNNKLSILVVYQ